MSSPCSGKGRIISQKVAQIRVPLRPSTEHGLVGLVQLPDYCLLPRGEQGKPGAVRAPKGILRQWTPTSLACRCLFQEQLQRLGSEVIPGTRAWAPLLRSADKLLEQVRRVHNDFMRPTQSEDEVSPAACCACVPHILHVREYLPHVVHVCQEDREHMGVDILRLPVAMSLRQGIATTRLQ